MKKIFTIAFFFIAIALCGCSNEDVMLEKEITAETDSLYTISFGTADFDLSSETRASSDKTIYGINIEYYKNGTRQGFYAYGLFDDMSKASITLIGGFTYNFTCSIVRTPEQGGDRLWYGPYSSNSFSGYADPFQLNSSVSIQCLNKFVEGTSSYLSGLGTGTSVCADNSTAGYGAKRFPKLERYYGKLEGFNPATDGTHVVIPVNKAYFGCKLILKGVKDGTLSTSSSNSDIYFLTASTTTEDKVKEEIYTFQDVASCWTNPSYSLSTTLNYTYISNRQNENGSPTLWNLSGSKTITFKRNVMTTITVSVTEDLSGASVGVSIEEMGPDNEIEFRVDDEYNLYQVDN